MKNKLNSELPLVSICFPVFNGERTLIRALDSLNSQDYENLEIIISDDNSTDKTFTICKRYKFKNIKKKIFKNKINIGANLNFQNTLKKAKGKYCFWACQDDYWKKNFISSLAKILHKETYFVGAMCSTVMINIKGKLLNKFQPHKTALIDKSLLKILLSILVKKRKNEQIIKTGLLIHGLIKTDVFQKIIYTFNGPFRGERQISFLLRVVGDFGYVKDELFFKELDSRPFNIRRRGDNNLLSRKITKFYQLKFYYEVIKSLFLLKDIKNVNFLKGLIAINVYLFNNFYIQSKIIIMKIINKIYKSK